MDNQTKPVLLCRFSDFFLYSLNMSPAQRLDLAAKLEIPADFIVVEYAIAIDYRQWRTCPFDYLVGVEF